LPTADAPITPVPLPMNGDRVDTSVRTLLLVGGSFDPPHKAHVHLPLLAARHLEAKLDEPKGVWIVYIPASRSPHKNQRPHATDAQRTEMLTLATGHLPRCAVWTDETDRAANSGGASYTVDTLRRLRTWLDNHGGEDVRLRLLIGADQAAAFDRWREPGVIVVLAEPLVMQRAEWNPDRAGGAPALTSHPQGFPAGMGDWSRRLLPIPTMDISSTAVRSAIAAGESSAAAKMLDPQVASYITAHGLYRPPGADPLT
jgi:nicotinate-nucleotide adenylyltransferase